MDSQTAAPSHTVQIVLKNPSSLSSTNWSLSRLTNGDIQICGTDGNLTLFSASDNQRCSPTDPRFVKAVKILVNALGCHFQDGEDDGFVLRMVHRVLRSVGNEVELRTWLEMDVELSAEATDELLRNMKFGSAKVCF
jgi:hypothetical protein